ncbi:MAG: prolyl oligopeptidase family serine peptidase [Bacteroidales bacterium]|nr:prolyl oligopeptidase family serine peptidase [Bacteroidales bacterium]
MIKKTIIFTLLLFTLAAYGEKKPLDHSVYDNWKSLGEQLISPDGRFVLYQIKPQEGDNLIVIRDLKKNKEIKIERGYNATITDDSKFAVCLIKAPFSDLREAKIKKKKAEDMPKDSLAIVSLLTGNVEKIANIKSLKFGNSFNLAIAYTIDSKSLTKKNNAVKNDSIKVNKKAKVNNKKQEDILIVHNLETSKEDTLKNVLEYNFNYYGTQLAAVVKGDSAAIKEVFHYSVNDGKFNKIANGLRQYSKLSFAKHSSDLAFLGSADTSILYSKKCDLFIYNPQKAQAEQVTFGEKTKGLPENWSISENFRPIFSEKNNNIFIGIAPITHLKDTTLIDFETAGLDIWHYADPLIQPMQLARKDSELKRTYLASVIINKGNNNGKNDIDNKKTTIVPLADLKRKDAALIDTGDAEYVFSNDNSPYEIAVQWEGSATPYDIYIVNVNDGEKKLIAKAIDGRASASQNGKFLIWFSGKNKAYYTYNFETEKITPITKNIDVNFFNEENDTPGTSREYGYAGWLEDDKYILIYDAYDIWKVDPKGIEKAVCVTNGEGRSTKTVLRNIWLNRKERNLKSDKTLLLSAIDKNTKMKGYYTLDINKKKLQKRIIEGYNYTNVSKAEYANVFLFQKDNFNTSPEMYITKDFWKSNLKLSDINPQMKDYLWGTSELYKWKTFSGKDAEGVLYKPENFDPEKKYPVMIYFYERVSDNLFNYVTPAPSRSIINISFYTSRGYIVFTPDIRYTTGEPGESAYDYIVSGAEALAKNKWINDKKMAIQGQSWGGYQVAYLITRTNMFACAGSGAPVSNMTSAYGGIRWTTGMSRQFQYELTQSRIGATLWDGLDLYIKNSPVFFADKVNTPLLIMHNDNDGSVPWYQGIEYFMALRRLGKKVWMLQYNKEEHNLVNRRNAKDLVVRLQQFFDHYLKDEPMPVWMKDGLPATKKGLEFGLEIKDEYY